MASVATRTGNIGIAWAGIVTTDATTGLGAVSFPSGLFKAAPVVSATGVASDGRDVVVTLNGDPTTTGCTVLARKSRTLAATIVSLAALAGFDVFQPVACKVHVIARGAS